LVHALFSLTSSSSFHMYRYKFPHADMLHSSVGAVLLGGSL
jgi:hypothetical protein